MSRGHGWVEREVLAILEACAEPDPPELRAAMPAEGIYLPPATADSSYMWLSDLTAEVHGLADLDEYVYATRAQTESVRRALKALKREGLVETTLKVEGWDAIRLAARLR